jgi:hypothetical protein
MEKQMLDVTVRTLNSGLIEISQGDPHEEYSIHIHPDQVETIMKWLQEAKKELIEKSQ